MLEIVFVAVGFYILIKIMDKVPGNTGLFK